MRYPLGVVQVTFGDVARAEAVARAAQLGFAHIDLTDSDPVVPMGLPVVDVYSRSPRPGCSTGAPAHGAGSWERAVRAFGRAPGSRIEAWAGSIIDSVDAIRAFLAEAPGTSLLLDTGHVANWGEDPAELIDVATHIQLRQARKGVPQAAEGDIDFGRFIAELDRRGYAGALSVEYFDLPDLGFPLEDPVGHAVALADRIRPLLQ